MVRATSPAASISLLVALAASAYGGILQLARWIGFVRGFHRRNPSRAGEAPLSDRCVQSHPGSKPQARRSAPRHRLLSACIPRPPTSPPSRPTARLCTKPGTGRLAYPTSAGRLPPRVRSYVGEWPSTSTRRQQQHGIRRAQDAPTIRPSQGPGRGEEIGAARIALDAPAPIQAGLARTTVPAQISTITRDGRTACLTKGMS
jgi:hypothetical protein